MSAKKWLIAFVITLAGLLALLCAFNWAIDPFGIFGDKLFNWYSYDMTQNPRASKIAYIDENHDNYDSYIIGCSSTSSYSVDTLNEYYDASFYNMIMYGADMKDVEDEAKYIIENYTCKNLIVNIYIDNALYYDVESDPLTYSMHAKADSSSTLLYYLRYLLAKPTYAIDKLVSWKNDTYLKQDFDAFNPQDGTYDKKARDAEGIGDTQSYLQNYPVFENYPQSTQTMTAIDQTCESLGRIKAMCEEKGINFTVVCAPVYWEYFDDFSREDVTDFYTSLAQVTDFWDFTMSSVSYEMRYFYDSTHFRNCVGDMAIARMFDDESIYIPEDFGNFVTSDNVQQVIDSFYTCSAAADDEISTQVPVLLYHHLDPEADGSNSMVVTPETFESQIKALSEAGYTGISIDQMRDYVLYGTPLPEKPVLITFDDGYLSNYEYAFPILQKYNMKATIFVIGSSVGHTQYYKDTQYPLTPHFDEEQMLEMVQSGLISIQSHTYDMHQTAQYEDGPARESMLKLPQESEESYIEAMSEDYELEKELIESVTGQSVYALAYPKGEYDELTYTVINQLGITVTFTTNPGFATLVKGLPQSLLSLNRFAVYDNTTPQQLLQMISPQ